MPGESSEAAQPSSINDSDAVLTGSSDHTPSRFNLGRYVRTVGLLFLVGISAACAPSPTAESRFQAMATNQPENATQVVPEQIQRATVRLEIGFNSTTSQSGMQESDTHQGMGLIIQESDNHDGNDSISILTVAHVAFGGYWKNLIIFPAEATHLPIFPDVNDSNDPNTWSVTNIINIKNQFALIQIHKPDSAESLLDGSHITFSDTPLYDGGQVTAVEAPAATKFNPVVETMTISGTFTDKDGNSYWETDANEPSINGGSGGVVINDKGEVVGLVYGWPLFDPTRTLIQDVFPDLDEITGQ